MSMDLNKLIEFVVTGAKAAFDKDGEVHPTTFAISGEDQVMIIPSSWGSAEERAQMLTNLKQLFQEYKVKRYVMVNEAWMRSVGPGDDLSVAPSKSDNREECLIISGTDGIKRAFELFDIVRPFDGSKPHLEPSKKMQDADKMGGDLFGLLDSD